MAEKISFAFHKPPKELEVRKIKTDRINDTYGSGYGKVRWRVEKIQLTGSPIRTGDILTTSRVYELARTIDRKAAHQFDLYNPKKDYDTREEE